MPRMGELTYYAAIGETGRRHAANKPFHNEERGPVFMQVGAILSLLPPPPARVLDCGCGTGWLSHLLQKCGYDVTGIDVAPDAVELARRNCLYADLSPPEFEVGEFETLGFDEEFDAIVFFDALHHAIDEQAAIAAAFRALKPSGVCIASETGPGHEEKSRDVVARYDVTEKSMPPRKIVKLGKQAGFTRWKIYPRADDLSHWLYTPAPGESWLKRLLRTLPYVRELNLVRFLTFKKRDHGIAVLHKPAESPQR